MWSKVGETEKVFPVWWSEVLIFCLDDFEWVCRQNERYKSNQLMSQFIILAELPSLPRSQGIHLPSSVSNCWSVHSKNSEKERHFKASGRVKRGLAAWQKARVFVMFVPPQRGVYMSQLAPHACFPLMSPQEEDAISLPVEGKMCQLPLTIAKS